MLRGMLRTCLVVGVVAGLTVSAVAQQSAVPAIAAAPAFSAEQLLAAPSDNWITNGGSVYNQR